MTLRVLVADDEEDIRAYLDVTLGLAGFDVVQAADGAEALAIARSQNPDVIILDVMMPGMDGIEALRILRRDARISHLPVLMLTAMVQQHDIIDGLDAGADDYVTKPVESQELIARIRAAIRRADQQRARNPLTGLPGNESILTNLSDRIGNEEPFALLYIDLDQFKPFNDYYGFLRGDEALRALARLVLEVQDEIGDEDTFVGHVGGDDFVMILRPEVAEPAATLICERFDDLAPGLYDPSDREVGSIEVADRRGVPQRYGLLSLSIGIASTARRDFAHHGEVVTTATEMKRYAKASGRDDSTYAFDRRADEDADGVEMEVDLPYGPGERS